MAKKKNEIEDTAKTQVAENIEEILQKNREDGLNEIRAICAKRKLKIVPLVLVQNGKLEHATVQVLDDR